MKRVLIVVGLLVLSFGALAQEGVWSGDLDVRGTKLTLVYHLDEPATLDVPDQGAKGIAATVEKNAFGGITIVVPSIGASFKGQWLGTSIAGTYSQAGMDLPLRLTPGEPKLNRPQTPKPPYPYKEETVTFYAKDADFAGTLLKPENCTSDTPVVLFVTGSGQQDRDETIYEHKPFAVIADALARRGIASLRYDDRGTGQSSGDLSDATTGTFKDDALAGVEYLRKQFRKVGVIGHSEGGSIAFMLAAEGKIDFVVSLAGAIVNCGDVLLEQNRTGLPKAGFSDADCQLYVECLAEAFAAIQKDMSPKADVNDTNLPAALKQNYEQVIRLMKMPYYDYFVKMDVSKMLDKVKCPVIAFNGTLDVQVDCKKNLDALRKGLPSATVKPVEGVNHLFQHCKTGQTDEYKMIEETFDPKTISEIIDWILALS